MKKTGRNKTDLHHAILLYSLHGQAAITNYQGIWLEYIAGATHCPGEGAALQQETRTYLQNLHRVYGQDTYVV